MTILEARNICRNYYDLTNPSEEDRFLLAEALDFLITETKEPDYMVELGGMYYEQRRFDLALKYYEMAAEYDNYRKRTANEKLSIYDDATAKAVTELLPVADSVGRALDNLKDADPEVLKGIELIQSQLDRSFEKLKVESYGAVGDDFDPKLHEAIATIESDEIDSDKIAAVFQTGYKIGDKVIRHAMVQVVS